MQEVEFFVTQDIYPNELITLYPGGAIIQWNDKDHIDERTQHGLQILFDAHIPQVEPSARDYEVCISDTICLIGDPVRCTDPVYLGQ
jgi:hypothetical protein